MFDGEMKSAKNGLRLKLVIPEIRASRWRDLE
jgi:hypothetical protein